ncbi:Ser/Thr protein phosphatase, putative [Trichomonas vaginalis G3]|uniref:Serine/threonine-protein phosphatase n=1 Tax=Trichomonas vaginalis (strain ATCC PRA-98 / G3) TaxID=412133 RepID=A2FUU2_TRIV3|nr:phosphoprotein phosphatase protein [Trichomonas vaginalis G3]EAX91331.1 Ser/Thr protein phosphatase, putative [Trichomonas vaginalis G3]KAI5547559.1 phosphoprotein phosphatase protein [Trichomonas vaginalis G3]|eukprot:XP_001304261.1 Ser/Thr protein phosphatase [Trichomonas vaginalis G3]
MNALNDNIQNLYDVYKCFTKRAIPGVDNDNNKIALPLLDIQTLRHICGCAAEAFRRDEKIMHLNGKFIVVGDLHGHLMDLFRIFKHSGWPPQNKYLFLGDIVDRGEFSLETCTIILLLKVLYPEHVYVIRGNHEFAEMYRIGGFGEELRNTYKDSDVTPFFDMTFCEIPIAAIINMRYLCIHGGIGPQFSRISELEMIPRPLVGYVDELSQTILWSDPSPYVTGFQPSSRGCGYFFGEDKCAEFIDRNAIDMIIRGHECVEKGVEFMFKRKCMTVFSASKYCNNTNNKCGIAVFLENDSFEITTFPPVKTYVLRSKSKFYSLDFFTHKAPRLPTIPHQNTDRPPSFRKPIPMAMKKGISKAVSVQRLTTLKRDHPFELN